MSDELTMLLGYLCDSSTPYPWEADPDPLAGGGEVWADALDDEALFGDRTVRFYENLGHLLSGSTFAPPVERLAERFGAVAPLGTLAEIVRIYRALFESDLPRGDRLLVGLQELLPQWSLEDLGLLARPYSFAFRGESSFSLQIPQKSWDQLSELERANYLVAIASYVVTELEQTS